MEVVEWAGEAERQWKQRTSEDRKTQEREAETYPIRILCYGNSLLCLDFLWHLGKKNGFFCANTHTYLFLAVA